MDDNKSKPKSLIGTIDILVDDLFENLRLSYMKHDDRYQSLDKWMRRILGSPVGKTIGVTASVNQEWAGGVVTIPAPMRGPNGEYLRGGKMEAMIVAPAFRGENVSWKGGGECKVSVAVSKALIRASLDNDLDIIFGVPNGPALRAHKNAGHGIIELKYNQLILVLHPDYPFGKDAIGIKKRVMKLLTKILWFIQLPVRRYMKFVGSHVNVQRVNMLNESVRVLDKEIADNYPSITIERREDYLNWRFQKSEYGIFTAQRDKKLIGYLAGKLPSDFGQAATIVDFLVYPNDKDVVRSLIGSFIRLAESYRAGAIQYLSYGSGLLEVRQRNFLSACGFVHLPSSSVTWIVDVGHNLSLDDFTITDSWSANALFLDF